MRCHFYDLFDAAMQITESAQHQLSPSEPACNHLFCQTVNAVVFDLR